MQRLLVILSFILASLTGFTQKKTNQQNLVYVDNAGVLRWTFDNKDAKFFGVNYTVPFAYGYRSHKAIGVDLEKAIDNDVYHMARLGLDAFRVHMWDVEISDTVGNLLNNEHLRLFDYLLMKLKERNIRVIITPIAFWGNGYPERDEKTPGFATKYGKDQSVVNPNAIKAQENYITQIVQHINPYTNSTYRDDENIIAMEINNEPHHSGPKPATTDYVNRLANAARNNGWSKPIFYNISESPFYSDAIAAANVNGHSFQWYPTGLVAGHTVKGNYLPNVDRYFIPFDSIASFKNRTKMVYEFDAGDILDPIMYPAMAKSFRAAGFQWATQFAYDPMATAYANTEYQTHFLNLAYTPAKAISLLIASKAFHRLQINKSYGSYPADSVFDAFRVSYRNSVSEMNTPEEFYYSNSTDTKPVNPSKLEHIAGVGSSVLVNYNGYGAYFLDKLTNSVWRLEIMPDALFVRDPFEKASPSKEVSRIQWNKNRMKIFLPQVGSSFSIKGVSAGNNFESSTQTGEVELLPGTYVIYTKAFDFKSPKIHKMGTIQLSEFVAPPSSSAEPFIQHNPFSSVTEGRSFILSAKIAGLDSADKISLELRNGSRWKTVPMQKQTVFDYTTEVPADMITPGLLSYRIIIEKTNGEYFVFPGAHKGNPYAWDAYTNETWQTFVAGENTPLELFNANNDRNNINLYNADWRNNRVESVTVDKPAQLVWSATIAKPAPGKFMAMQVFVGDKMKGRESELNSFDRLVIRARTTGADAVPVKLALTTKDAFSFTGNVMVTNQFSEIEIPLQQLKQDSMLLLPRPYPGFLPLWFLPSGSANLRVADLDKVQIYFGEFAKETQQPLTLQVEYIRLKKANQ